MHIQAKTSGQILNQIASVINQLTDEDYSKPLNILSDNSIGKHVRHIIEFYECLNQGYALAAVDYDSRSRNPVIETSRDAALEAIDSITTFISSTQDKPFILMTTYPGSSDPVNSNTSYKRELIYNIEHAIHHMAIIKIALLSGFPKITIDTNFGVAYSTIQYQDAKCAQ